MSGCDSIVGFYRSLHKTRCELHDPVIPGTNSYDDVNGTMECNLLHHSLPVFKPWKLDRSSTRQDGGWEITDEIVRFLFAGTYFSSTALFVVVE